MHRVVFTEQGVKISAEGDCLVAWRGEHRFRHLRVGEIEQLLLVGHVDMSHGAMMLLVRRGVDVVWLSQSGQFRARLVGPWHKNSLLRLAQYRRTTDEQFAVHVSSKIIAAKIHQQRQILLRAQRRLKSDQLSVSLAELRQLVERVEQVRDLETLRGLEGRAAAVYFQHFGLLVTNNELTFNGRSRRPPRDEINAMLSFGYAVLGSVIQSEIATVGLDPMLGFFHQPHYGRPALMLDVLELYRPWVDQLVLRLVNRRQLGPGDFDRRSDKSVEEILADDESSETVVEFNENDDFPQEAVPDEATPAGSQSPGPSVTKEANQAENISQAVPANNGAGLPSNPPQETANPSRQDSYEVALQHATPTAVTPPEDGLGVFLNETGRKIFFAEFYRKLREERFYSRKQARFETGDIIREEIYHLARVIEEKEPYQPFLLDER